MDCGKENKQPVETFIQDDGSSLDVQSIFWTIQGEGPLVGTPAVFVRLAGCNLQCPGCDTDYTSSRKKMTVGAILLDVAFFPWKHKPLVVLSGGEPMRQNIVPLVNSLLNEGYRVQIETNGSFYRDLPPGALVVCSPKTAKVHPKLLPRVNAWKYVLSFDSIAEDGLPVSVLGLNGGGKVARPPPKAVEIYVQPADDKIPGKNAGNLRATIRSAMANNYRLCVQVHKQVGLD